MALEKKLEKLDEETLARIRKMRLKIAEALYPIVYAARQSTKLSAEDYMLRITRCPIEYS